MAVWVIRVQGTCCSGHWESPLKTLLSGPIQGVRSRSMCSPTPIHPWLRVASWGTDSPSQSQLAEGGACSKGQRRPLRRQFQAPAVRLHRWSQEWGLPTRYIRALTASATQRISIQRRHFQSNIYLAPTIPEWCALEYKRNTTCSLSARNVALWPLAEDCGEEQKKKMVAQKLTQSPFPFSLHSLMKFVC